METGPGGKTRKAKEARPGTQVREPRGGEGGQERALGGPHEHSHEHGHVHDHENSHASAHEHGH